MMTQTLTHLLDPPELHVLVLGTRLLPEDLPALRQALALLPEVQSFTIDWEDRDRVLRILATQPCDTAVHHMLHVFELPVYELA